jgi:PDDEXK-like domain of unknown function (DUF3799)
MTAPGEIQTGILDITNEEHHRIRALSNSGMRDLAVSPLRYWYRWINPAPQEEREETAAQSMGSALHCAVLESEEAFEARYARALSPSDWPMCLDTIQDIRGWITDKGEKPKGTRKDEVIAHALDLMLRIGEEVPILQVEEARFRMANEGKTILNPDEWERLAGMAQALAEEPALKPILESGKPEVSIVARDPETGVLLKARLDWMAPGTTLDLKSFTVKRGGSIDQAIHDAIYYESYYRQAYFYDLVRRLATGEDQGRTDFVFAFVESDQPHETRLTRLEAKRGGSLNLFWERARIEVRTMIREYAECLAKFGDDPWREKQEIRTLADEDIRQLAYA